jgi:hypothetical protein
VGYEQMLGTLSPRPRHDDRPDDTPRQFIFADGHGGVEKIRIDLEAPHLEHVREALDTNPDASRVAVPGAPARAAVRAPDEPGPAAPRQVAPLVRAPAVRGADLGTDLGDDLDEEFADLDDPDGLFTSGRPGSGVPVTGRRVVPRLHADEDLDLLADVDPGVDVVDAHPNGTDNGLHGPAGGKEGRMRPAGEAVR